MEYLFVLVIAALVIRFAVIVVAPSKGEAGERKAVRMLRRSFDDDHFTILSDLILPAFRGTTQIDAVVISRYGLWVIEVKNFDGWLFASPTDKQWTQVLYKERNSFQNPLHQNYKHLKAIEAVTGVHHRGMKNIVLFVGSAKFKTEQPSGVYRGFKELYRSLKNETHLRFTDPDVRRIVKALQDADGANEKSATKNHIQTLREDHKPARVNGEAPNCPRCGSIMALRTARKTGDIFWGCSRFPACKGTRRGI